MTWLIKPAVWRQKEIRYENSYSNMPCGQRSQVV